jgi:PAS domain S-box-containing protein
MAYLSFPGIYGCLNNIQDTSPNLPSPKFALSSRQVVALQGQVNADDIVATGAMHTDTNERDRVAEALRQSEARFRDIAEISGDWIWEMDADLRYTFVSVQFYDLMGLPYGAFNGKTREELAETLELAHDWPVHINDLENHRPFRDIRYATTIADGQIRHIRISGKPVFDGSGVFLGYRGTGSDITEITEAISALRDNEEVFRSIIDNSPGAIALKGLDGRFQFVNRSFRDWYGVSQKDVLNKTSEEIFSNDFGDEATAHDRDVIELNTVRVQESFAPFADGSEHFLSVTRFPIRNADGEITGVGSINVDVTDRNRTEREIAEKSALLQAILDAAPTSISYRDANGKFVFVNKQMATEMGVKPEDYVGKSLTETHGAILGETVDQLVSEVLNSGQPIFSREIRPARIPGHIHRYSVVPMFKDSGDISGVLSIGQDVTA